VKPLARLRKRLIATRAAEIPVVLGIYAESLRDATRHARHALATDARSNRQRGLRQLEGQITRDYHRLEKGLALKEPRRFFGVEPMARLTRDISRYRAMGGNGSLVDIAESALSSVDAWNSTGEVTGSAVRFVERTPEAPLTRDQAEAFFATRASVRDFDPMPVTTEEIREAVELAMYSPSVCNRQAWGVHSVHDRDRILEVLELQNGNAGFRHQVPCVLVVTADLRLFAGARERNQRWVDGGLFAMSLVWALHAGGLVSCMLNWSVRSRQTVRLRRVLGLPDHLDVVTLIAAGHPPSTYKVTRSPRRSIDEVHTTDGRPAP
jgi:nitroreductase